MWGVASNLTWWAPQRRCSVGGVFSTAGLRKGGCVWPSHPSQSCRLWVILEKLKDGMCERSFWSWKDRAYRSARALWICSHCRQKHLLGAKPLFAGTVRASSSGRADRCPAAMYKQFNYQLFTAIEFFNLRLMLLVRTKPEATPAKWCFLLLFGRRKCLFVFSFCRSYRYC